MQKNSILWETPRNGLILLASSWVIAYAGYVFVLQTPYFFSRARLAYGIFAWILLLLALYALQVKTGPVYALPGRKFPIGVAGLFLFLNLLWVALFHRIPYTFMWMPSQRVTIAPLSADAEIEIKQFVIENGGYQGINQFAVHEGWLDRINGFFRQSGDEGDLLWEGKPGKYVTIDFFPCASCGRVQIITTRGMEEIDLAQPNYQDVVRHQVEYNHLSLSMLQAFNFLSLELATALLAFILFRTAQWFARWNPRLRSPQNNPGWPTVGAWQNGLPFGGLAVSTVILYGLKLKPILYNDDWCQIVYSANAKLLQPFMIAERRPFHMLIPALFNLFLPIEKTLIASYIIQLVLIILTAFLTYLILQELFDGNHAIALLGAALWLVFPNDYTFTTLSLLAARYAYFLCLMFMLLTLRLVQKGDGVSGAAASLVLAFSFLMYEGQLGLALLWPMILLWRYWGKLTTKRVLWLAVNYFMVGGLVIWKVFFQSAYYEDSKLLSLNTSIGEMILRWFEASRSILGGFRLPYNDWSWLTAQNGWLTVLVGLCWLGLAWIAVALHRSKKEFSLRRGYPGHSYWTQLVAGAALWFAGYFPILINYPPNIYSHLSRVNLFANLGAVVILLTVFQMLAHDLQGQPGEMKFVLVLTLPLLVIGSLVQVQVQEANNRSWAEAKTFFDQLIQEVPDIREDTQVILLITPLDMGKTPRRPLFTSSWEASCAFLTLYDTIEPHLTVGYRYNDLYVPPFPGYHVLGGAFNSDSVESIRDPGKLLVLDYDMKSQKLEIRYNVDFLLDGNAPAYDPNNVIISTQPLISARKVVDP